MNLISYVSHYHSHPIRYPQHSVHSNRNMTQVSPFGAPLACRISLRYASCLSVYMTPVPANESL